jgi:hypothetical protein
LQGAQVSDLIEMPSNNNSMPEKPERNQDLELEFLDGIQETQKREQVNIELKLVLLLLMKHKQNLLITRHGKSANLTLGCSTLQGSWQNNQPIARP